MDDWRENIRFFYSAERADKGFWYSRPFDEAYGLTEEQLFWIPNPRSLCILWHVGHIAHRERSHLGVFCQGLPPSIIPAKFEVFGPDWHSVEEIRASVESVDEVFAWVREVRSESRRFIDSLSDDDMQRVPEFPEDKLTITQWLIITAAHTALHIGRIQLLRALIEGGEERAC